MLELGLLVVGILIVWAIVRRRGKASPSQSPEASGSPRPPNEPEPPAIQHVINNPAGEGVVPAAPLPGTGRGYFVQVVGESHYQDVLRGLRARSGGEREQSVILSPEPENPHDPNAVAVKTFQNDTIGYLAREEACRHQPTLLELRRRGLVSFCSAKFLWGRGDKQNIGVWLDLEDPMAVAAKFGVKYKRQKRDGSPAGNVPNAREGRHHDDAEEDRREPE